MNLWKHRKVLTLTKLYDRIYTEIERGEDTMEKKIEIVKALVENGYYLMGESVEDFASRFTVENLEMFLDAFLHRV